MAQDFGHNNVRDEVKVMGNVRKQQPEKGAFSVAVSLGPSFPWSLGPCLIHTAGAADGSCAGGARAPVSWSLYCNW